MRTDTLNSGGGLGGSHCGYQEKQELSQAPGTQGGWGGTVCRGMGGMKCEAVQYSEALTAMLCSLDATSVAGCCKSQTAASIL